MEENTVLYTQLLYLIDKSSWHNSTLLQWSYCFILFQLIIIRFRHFKFTIYKKKFRIAFDISHVLYEKTISYQNLVFQ